MPLRAGSALALFLVLGALTTAAAAQSTQPLDKQFPVAPPAQLFATPHGSVPAPEPRFQFHVAAPEPQFQFHFAAPILKSSPPMIASAETSRCFTLRSYHFAPNNEPAEPPQLQSYSTCTPSTGRELHPTVEPPTPNR